jgi:hypothetical protein
VAAQHRQVLVVMMDRVMVAVHWQCGSSALTDTQHSFVVIDEGTEQHYSTSTT